MGVYVSSHPLDEYYLILKYICTLRINDFEKAKITQCGQELILGGMVTNYREGHTKAGSSFGILKLEDFTGSREIPLFGKDYIKYRKYGHPNVFLYIVGAFMPNIQLSKNVSFKIKAIQLLNEIVVQKITILLPLHRLNEKVIRDLESVTKNKHGNTSLYFNIREGYELEDNNEEKQISILLKSENGKYFIDKKFVQYLEENKIKFEIN